MSDGNITSSVNLDVHGDANIRFGELPKKTVRDSIGIDTDITSPYSYFKRRNELYEDVKDDQRIDALEHEHLLYWNRYQMCVSINIFNGTIVFHENILTTVNGASISGRIIMDKNLAALKINTETTYTALDLSKLLKMNRLLFSSAEANMKLVADLRAFKAKIETEIESANDSKGNKVALYAQRMAHEYNLKFTLTWPVIHGGPVHKFEVEINHDVRDRSIVFWLESVELHEIKQKSIKDMVMAEAKKFEEAGVPVVYTQ